MEKRKLWSLLVFGAFLFTTGLSFAVWAGAIPGNLRGKIITSPKSIELPERNLLGGLLKQDRQVFTRDSNGAWSVNLVAFFRQPTPAEQLGVVVLDGKNEAVAVATVNGVKGQTTLACSLLVDSTESPGQEHKLQVFYVKNGEPVVLAEKTIVLK